MARRDPVIVGLRSLTRTLRRRVALWALLATAPLLACQPAATGPQDLRCSFGGRFPPTDCAYIRGVALTDSGVPWARLVVRVDSVIPMVGYAYASDAVWADDSGQFLLRVARVNRLSPRSTPDTATIELKGYANGSVGPVAVALVRAQFVPRDSLAVVTEDEFRFIRVPPP